MKTVRDLRAALKGLPGDMPVLIDGRDDWEAGCDDTCMIARDGGGPEPCVALSIELFEDED